MHSALIERAAPAEWPAAPGWFPLDCPAAQRITAIEDAAVRNVLITQSYADLGRRLLDLLETDQTWCTFAIWASNTAGVSIRGEELPHLVERVMFGTSLDAVAIADRINAHLGVPRRLRLARLIDHTHIEHLVAEAIAQVSAHIGHGNALVYGELAPLFVGLLEHVERHGAPAPVEIDAVLSACGVPDADRAPLVRTAFRHYAMAIATTAGTRAQHVLAANVAAVLHEQQRLQPDIVAALDAGLDDVGNDLVGTGRRWLPARLDRWVGRHLGGWLQRRVTHVLLEIWESVATHLMMTLTVPGEVLHLGRDVPPLPGGAMFPAALEAIELPELIDLLAAWGPAGCTGHGSAAHDWADLHQRMGYIVTLFRSRQRHLLLTAPPFSQAEIDAAIAGHLAPGL